MKNRISAMLLALVSAAGLGMSAYAQDATSTPPESAPDLRAQNGASEPLPTTLGEMSYYILLAELAARRGELETALENYRIAARLSDDVRIAERATGMALYVKDDAATLALAQRWHQLDPDDLRARQALALALLREGQIEPALEHLEAARLAAEDSQDGFATLAALLEQTDDREIGYQVLGQFRDRMPDSQYAQYFFAVAAVRSNHPDEALESLRKALEIAPQWREGLLLSTQIRIRQGETEAALNELGQAVLAAPSDRELRLGYARLLVAGEQLERARAQFEMLAEQNPSDADSLYALGLLAAEAEQFDVATDYFQRVLALDQRVNEVYFELGKIDEQRERFEQAQQWYEQVGQGERYLRAQVRAATVQAKRGELDAMTNRLAGLRVNFPNEAVSLYVTEAEVLRDQKLFERAFEILDSALLDYPKNNELFYARALAAERIDRLDVLEHDLRAILHSEPDNAHALNALGYTLADRTDRFEEALELLERAVVLLPDDPAVLDSMGWVNYRLGRLEPALEYLRRAYAINDDAEIVAHLAEVLWHSGEKTEARTLWRDAFEQFPDNKHLLRMREQLAIDQ